MPLTRRRVRSYHNYSAAGSTIYGSDAFTGTDGTALHSHTPVAVGTNPAGTSWTDLNGTFNALQLLNGRLAVVGSVTSGTFRSVMSQAATPAADQLAAADLVMFTSITGMRIGLGVGMTGGTQVGGYYLKFSSASPNQFILERVGDDFSSTILGGPTTFTFPAPGTTVPVTLRRVGAVITVTVNGSVMFSVTDPTPLAGTKCGVMANPDPAGVNCTTSTGVHLDNLVFQSYP